MFPVMVFPWPLTLGSYEVKGGCGSHVLRKYDRQGSVWSSQLFPVGPLCSLSTSAILASWNRLRDLSPKVLWQPSQGLELGCGE